MNMVDEFKILNQCVDTLVIGIRIKDEKIYKTKFSQFKSSLRNFKEQAKAINSYGEKFVKSDFLLGYGEFKIFSMGIKQYFGRFDNSEISVKVSDVSFNSSTIYHLVVEFRSIFLFKFGHIKAYEYVKEFLDALIAKDAYCVSVLRIDLATDVSGIFYEGFDYLRFRTLKKIGTFVDRITIDSELNYMRFNKFNGFSFGKSPFMFRIYDKTKEILNKEIELPLITRWKNNGLDKKLIVYRHEVEYGSKYLKDFIPKGIENEVEFIFNNLNFLWKKCVENIRFYNLSINEIQRIQSGKLKSSSVAKIYERNFKSDDSNFWNKMQNFKASSDDLIKQENLKVKNFKAMKRAFKSFISSVYKNSYPNLDCLPLIMDEVNVELSKDGLSLHQYGLMSVMDSFIKNQSIDSDKNDYLFDIKEIIDDLKIYYDNSKNKEFRNLYKKTISNLKDIK